MILAPKSGEELARQISEASARIASVDLSNLRSMIEHAPEDMTATVEAGMTLANFQAALRKHGQWVPLDPPRSAATTIGEILARDLSGPRRCGYGTAREYVIGMRVVIGSGELIKAGGKVVKNVAGYDLCRLFIGARHSLGIIVEATFKLRPVPELETILQRTCESFAEAAGFRALLEPLEPVILDLHNVHGSLTLVTGFAGIREDVVNQTRIAAAAGFNEAGTLNYEIGEARKASVLPSEIFQFLGEISESRFIARLANGIVYYQGSDYQPAPVKIPMKLMARMKEAYDPKHILPEYSA
jgi:FAD/FMN-containing dehydrogenase